jgi:hypothetical protein
MKEISSGRSRTNIQGLGEKKIETKEGIGLENRHLGLERKKDGEEAGVGPDRRSMTTFPSFTPSQEDLEVEENPAR